MKNRLWLWTALVAAIAVLALSAGRSSADNGFSSTGTPLTSITGDVSCTSGNACTIANVTNLNTFTIEVIAKNVSVTGSAVAAIWSEPAESANTTYDYIVTVNCANTPNDGGAMPGDSYGAELRWREQRIGSSGPTAVGPVPVATNVVTTGAGNTWTGPTVTLSSNTQSVNFGVLASTTALCSVRGERSYVGTGP